MSKHPMRIPALVLLLVLGASAALAGARAIPSSTFPAPFGVNIHYTGGQPGETDMLGKAFRVVRMDFAWNATERAKGQYDFSAYDGLLRELDAQGITPLFILDYGNDLYQAGPPRTPEARAAYARWAAAAVRHYRGRKVLWEFWNEPNGDGFWGGHADANEYANLVLDAGPAVRAADPDATLLVGAMAGFPWDYIDTILRRGVLKYADAFSVHPYRSGTPETVVADYARLRRMLHRYAPDREVPILSGEWGYSTNTKSGVPEERQAQYLVRQRLINARCGVPLSIWYDWKNDGPDPQENEHRFGTVTEQMAPKPSFTAARVMAETLSGYRCARMLREDGGASVMLLRNDKGESALALWSTGSPDRYTMPGPATLVEMMGDRRSAGQGEIITLGPSPVYALLGKSAALDASAMWWWLHPLTVVASGANTLPHLVVKNATSKPRRYEVDINVEGGTVTPGHAVLELAPGKTGALSPSLRIDRRDVAPVARVTVRSTGEGGTTTDTGVFPLVLSDPISVSVGPAQDGRVAVTLDSPGGSGTRTLTVSLEQPHGLTARGPATLSIAPGAGRASVRIPVSGVAATYAYGVRVADAEGREVAAMPAVTFRRLFDFEGSAGTGAPRGMTMHPEGDESVGGRGVLSVAQADGHGAVADVRAEFPDGWRYFVVAPEETAIPEGAVAVGMWVNGDGSGDALRCRIVDAKGQTYQSGAGAIDWTGWRWVTMPLNDPTVGSWGGPQDGVIHQPIRWDSVFLLDSNSRKAHAAHVQFDDVTLILGAR